MTISSQGEPQLKRFWTLDVLRGIAILGVVSFHVLPLDLPVGSPLASVRYGGKVGVSLFFVLSGFSIHLSQLRKGEKGQFSWQPFLWQRLKRLYPPYLAAIILAIAINITWAWLKGQPFFSLAPSPVDLIAHLFLVHPFSPTTFFGIIPALWFIGVLSHFYLLYPCFRKFIQSWGNTTALLIVLGITLITRVSIDALTPQFPSAELTAVLQNNAPQRWFEWCMGAWVATRILHKDAPLLWFSGCTGLLFVVWIAFHSSLPWLSEPLLGLCLGSLIWHLVSWEAQWSFHSLWQPWFYLGQFSYPIYLLHQIFVPYLRSALDPSPFAPLPIFLLLLMGVLLLTLPLSIVFYYLLEKPRVWRREHSHERS